MERTVTFDDRNYQLVPRKPTHAMERAYFTAKLPEFTACLSKTQRNKRNKKKMEARWAAMLAACSEIDAN